MTTWPELPDNNLNDVYPLPRLQDWCNHDSALAPLHATPRFELPPLMPKDFLGVAVFLMRLELTRYAHKQWSQKLTIEKLVFQA